MCNCSKPIEQSECQILRELVADGRFFVYFISDKLNIAHVPKGVNPNDIARERRFINEKNELEWYNIKEHPCLYE